MVEALVQVSCENRLGEAINWQPETNRLMWLDLLNVQLFIHSLARRVTEDRKLELEAPLGGLVATNDPDVVMISHRHGIVAYRISQRTIFPFCNPEAGRDAIAYNDGKIDRFGRLWVGTSHILEKEARGALWCVEASGACTLGDVGFVVGNGPAFSPDGSKLYFNDTLGRQTLQYDVSASDPHPRNRMVLTSYEEAEGYPDGITVDAEGCLWIAHWGGSRVTRLSPAGDRKQVIDIPVLNVTSLCFGGSDYRTLFVTTACEATPDRAAYPRAGGVFAVRPGVGGLLEPCFAWRPR
jgi:D-xylonolactonase